MTQLSDAWTCQLAATTFQAFTASRYERILNWKTFCCDSTSGPIKTRISLLLISFERLLQLCFACAFASPNGAESFYCSSTSSHHPRQVYFSLISLLVKEGARHTCRMLYCRVSVSISWIFTHFSNVTHVVGWEWSGTLFTREEKVFVTR